jgi:NhaA family Na+:H+ antiporter
VSLFVTGLAYDDGAMQSDAKLGILVASVVAAGLGAAVLSRAVRPAPTVDESPAEVSVVDR